MATLVSPGASVTVQNDSFYAASGSGSVPLVIFATAQDKLVPGSTSVIADGTKKENAGKLYLMTSQRDALQAFGMPIFQENAGSVVQGDELNEYGLHAMFSALGITNRAYALRADIDLHALSPTQVEPRGAPQEQSIWFDIKTTDFGIFENNGLLSPNEMVNWKKVNVVVPAITQVSSAGVPSNSFGVIGDYTVIPYMNDTAGIHSHFKSAKAINTIYKKSKSDIWVQVAPIYNPLSPPTGTNKAAAWVKLDSAAGGMNFKVKRYAAGVWTSLIVKTGKTIIDVEAALSTSVRAGAIGFISDASRFVKREHDLPTILTALSSDLHGAITLKYTDKSKVGVQTLIHTFTTAEAFVSAINTHTSLVASASTAASITTLSIRSLDGRAFELEMSGSEGIDGMPGSAGSLIQSVGDNWDQMEYTASLTTPSDTAVDDTLWYDDSLYADVMINDGGRWCGLQSVKGMDVFGSDAEINKVDIQFRQSQPLTKPAGGDLTYGDIWIDPVDGTDYEFYQFDGKRWMKLDQTDQSTTLGVLFAHARSSDASGAGYFTTDQASAYKALIVSDYVDAMCPDPRLYPRGMLMVNIGQTGGVVRRYSSDAFAEIKFDDVNDDAIDEEFFVGDPMSYERGESGFPDPLFLASVGGSKRSRWLTASGVAEDGSGLFGRKAQRKMVVQSMGAAIIGNDDLRAETIEFNIATAPGYPELLDEMITMNVDRKETAYLITDVPARLSPSATSINEWAKNMNNAVSNGEKGRTSRYDFAAQYMGWCLGTNVDGKEVCIPGSTIALRTYLFNDSVSYVWFPPAGTERGVVTNAATVGYITSEQEYAPVIYNQGQRDTMYLNNINPIALRPNRGLIVFGDKSLAPEATALDRVNVGRLVVYIRTQISKISERFLFKLNTPRVQEEFAGALTSFLANIVLLEGLEDFAVVCDSSNNTATRRQRNELWADIAIVPTKSINFVYVPIRIQNASN